MAVRGSGRRAAINAARSLKRQAHGPVGLLEQWRPSQDGTDSAIYGFSTYDGGKEYAAPGIGQYGTVYYGDGTTYDGPEVEPTARYGYCYYGRNFHYS